MSPGHSRAFIIYPWCRGRFSRFDPPHACSFAPELFRCVSKP
jgi:hypothetical protein